MDFTTLKRKELQSLCKKHGIPANLSNAEMVKRISSLFEVKEKKKAKSCLRSVNNEVDNVDEESKKEGKRVKFSPQNETFEFERTDPRACRLLARKTRSMAKPQIEADLGLVSNNVKNPVGNSRNSKRKTMVNSQIEGNNLADVGCVEVSVGRNLRRKSMAVSVCEGVSNVDMVLEKGNVGRNVRRSVVKVGEGFVSEDVGEVEKPVRGVNVGRNLRRKSRAVSVSQDEINVEMVEQEGKLERNMRRSVVKVDKGLVSEDVGKVEKSIEGANVGINLRSRGKKMMKGKEELTLFSPCVERRAERGRKGSQVVNEGCVDRVDNNVSIIDETDSDMMVTRRLRSRDVRVENLGKVDDFNEKSENIMPVPRRSCRQTNKGKSRDDSMVDEGWRKDAVTNQDVKNQPQGSVEVVLRDGKRKGPGKKTSSGMQQEAKQDFDGDADKVNINVKNPEESNACKVENDFQEGIEDVKVAEKRGQRRNNIIVEEDRGIKEMHAAKQSTRRAKGLDNVDASLSEPVLDEIVPQSNDHMEEGEKETIEVVTSDDKPNGCVMENVDDVRTDHTSVEELPSGAATLDDSVSENEKSEVEVEIHETGSAISVEQKEEKCEVDMHVCVTSPLSSSMVDVTESKDSVEETLGYKDINVQRPAQNESPSPFLLEGDCFEDNSAVQNSNMEMRSKAHVVSSISSQEDCECIVPLISTEMFDGIVDVAEPDCGNIAKPTTPCSSRAVNIDGENSTVENSEGNNTLKTAGASIIQNSDDHLMEQEGLSGSREISDNIFKESGGVTPKISSVRRTDQHFQDEKTCGDANDKPSFASTGLTSAFATEYDPEKEDVGNQSVTPKQNLEVGSSSNNHEEPKVVDSQSADSGEGSPKPMTINISYLFANTLVDEQCNADVGKSELEDVTEPNCGVITNPTSPRSSKVDDIDCGSDNMKNAEGRKIVDQSDDQIVQEVTAFTRDICDNIFTESECMATDNSNVQILDHYIPVEKVEIAFDASVKENIQPSAILDGSTPVSPATLPAGHTLIEENVDTETTTPLQNLGGGSSEAFSGSISINISSLFIQSSIKEQCQANDDYIFTEMKEETSKENIQLSEESSRCLKLTESNNIVQMAPEDVETIAESPANNRKPVPSQNDHVSCADASTPMCTSTAKFTILESSTVIDDYGLSCQQFVSVEGAKSSCQKSNDQLSKLHLGFEGSIAESGFAIESKLQDGTSIFEKSGDQMLIVVDQGKEPEPKDGQVVDQGKEPEPKDGQVVDQGKEPEPKDDQVVDQGKEPEPKDDQVVDQGKEPEPKDDQVVDQGKEPEPKDDQVVDQGKEPEPKDDQVVDQGKGPELKGGQVVNQGKEPEPKDDQVVDQEKELGSKEGCDSTFKEAEHTALEALNSDESTKIGEPSAVPPIVIDRLSPLSEVSLCKPVEKSVQTNSVTSQQSQETEFRSINEDTHYMFESQATDHTEDMLDSFPNFNTKLLLSHSPIDDELIVSQDSLKKGEESEREMTRNLSCFNNTTKLDYFVEHDESLANQQPEDGQNFIDAKLHDIDMEDDISNSNSIASGVAQENDNPGECAVLLQDKKSDVVPYETNNFSIAAKDNVTGIYAADNAVECLFGSEYWSETWQITSEDKGSDTPQRACLADDKELCLTTSILKEDNQDCEGDVKSMEDVNSPFHESAMVAEAKPEMLTCDISLSTSNKSPNEVVSPRNNGSSPHFNSPLSKFQKAVDNDGTQGCCDGDLQSGKAWIDHTGEKESEVSGSGNAWKVVELSGVATVDNEKFNSSGVLTEFAGDEGDKIVGHPDMNEAQNQYQIYPDSGYEHLSSQIPGDGMATTPEQIDDGLHGILEAEGNQDQDNSTESCMFSKWELDFIYGEMVKDINEVTEGSSEKSTSKNENDSVNPNPQEHVQITPLQVPGNFHDESPDRKHGKITETGTDNAGHIDKNKVANPSSMIKRNVNRSILIHGTPKKPVLLTHDMKENAPASKMLKMVDVTAVRPIVKRKALGDLGK